MAYTTLVDTSVLASHIDGRASDDTSWIVFDCRHDLAKPEAGSAEYLKGHIPGAFFAHLDRDLAGSHTGRNGRHPLPDPKLLADFLARAGLTPGKQLVAYDAQGGIFAARLWWLARWLGHRDVAVLDGGWQQWIAEGRPQSTLAQALAPAPREKVTQGTPDSNWLDADSVLAGLGKLTLIDARAPDRFRGENETLDPVGGRIPGARNRFFRDNLEPGGKFKTAGKLGEEFKTLLAGSRVDSVVHSCGSGVSACHNLLAMEIAGMPGSRLYPGSWSEWCADPARPIARGNP
jgi:thiosulfate/3-mercaptopyruvate sulfurtransferase